MGNYADSHGGNSFFGNLVTAATHPFNPGTAIQNKYQEQIDTQNLILQQNLFKQQQQTEQQKLATEQAATDAAASSAGASNAVKYGIFIGIGIILIGGIVFLVKSLKKKKPTA